MKRSIYGVRRSKVKVQFHQNRSQEFLSARCLENYLMNFNSTWLAHIMYAHCVTATLMQEVNV